MNTVTAYVDSIESEPYRPDFEGIPTEETSWHVDVLLDSHGRKSESTMRFDSKDEALDLEVGDKTAV